MNVSMLGVADHGVQLATALVQRLELVVGLEPLRGEARSSTLEHAAKLDCVVDVGTGELAHHEAAARKRLEEPFVLERHESDPERCPRHAELPHQPKLGNALARLERPVSSSSRSPSVAFVVCEFAWLPRGTTRSLTGSRTHRIGGYPPSMYANAGCAPHDEGALDGAQAGVVYMGDVLATLSSSRRELYYGSRRTGVGASSETSTARKVGSGYGLTGSPVENVAASLGRWQA